MHSAQARQTMPPCSAPPAHSPRHRPPTSGAANPHTSCPRRQLAELTPPTLPRSAPCTHASAPHAASPFHAQTPTHMLCPPTLCPMPVQTCFPEPSGCMHSDANTLHGAPISKHSPLRETTEAPWHRCTRSLCLCICGTRVHHLFPSMRPCPTARIARCLLSHPAAG